MNIWHAKWKWKFKTGIVNGNRTLKMENLIGKCECEIEMESRNRNGKMKWKVEIGTGNQKMELGTGNGKIQELIF